VDDARQRVTRWREEAPSIVEMVAQVVRECAQLREELTAAREESDGLKRERNETGAMLAEALGRAGEALMRLRPPADLGVSPPLPEPPTSADAAPLVLAVPPADSGESGAPRRVLLVDDDQSFRNVITEYLEGFRGYEVRAAVSGEEGMRALADYQPDIVLLDLMMPGIGGMAALRQMKALYPSLCVVMVTANEDLSLARKALALGAADYVTKPFDLDYLDALLNIYLPKGGAACREGELTSHAAVDGPSPVASGPWSLRSYFMGR
jgi:two-component system OmpR family response regulator